MADGILTRPLLQSLELLEVPMITFTHTGSGWERFLAAEPMRAVALVRNSSATGNVILAPDPVNLSVPVVPPLTDLPMVLHMSMLPGFIGGSWWAFTLTAQDIYVWQMVRKQ